MQKSPTFWGFFPKVTCELMRCITRFTPCMYAINSLQHTATHCNTLHAQSHSRTQAHAHTHICSHMLSLSLFLSLILSLPLSLVLSLSLSHTHTHALSLSHFLPPSPPPTFAHSLSHTHKHIGESKHLQTISLTDTHW